MCRFLAVIFALCCCLVGCTKALPEKEIKPWVNDALTSAESSALLASKEARQAELSLKRAQELHDEVKAMLSSCGEVKTACEQLLEKAKRVKYQECKACKKKEEEQENKPEKKEPPKEAAEEDWNYSPSDAPPGIYEKLQQQKDLAPEH